MRLLLVLLWVPSAVVLALAFGRLCAWSSTSVERPAVPRRATGVPVPRREEPGRRSSTATSSGRGVSGLPGH